MPKLYRSSDGRHYLKTLNRSGRVITLQIDNEGIDWLTVSGYKVGDELGSAYWDLYENEWLYTKGFVDGGGEIEELPTAWVQHEALRSSSVHPQVLPSEPLTIPCNNEFASVPRFLYAPNKSIYYTILYVENSSDAWLQIPLLIKHRGATELLNLGAVVGDEFTETGLQLLIEQRWVYLDDDRIP